ncbi:hypothetical protein H6P81_009010 [Aristolochia fimbriata]|uniref:Uncharacterized protein n=1 Tax=Aristolochia fimbriata TaxID=158543 RepID=A0AAV7EJL7_ARIFI|nr:hypothetical protein H6P81_009010 [Aristolochia fimbriata]
MIGGNGPNSYAMNSSNQRDGGLMACAVVKEVILKDSGLGRLSSGNPFRIADLGCSVGPNTFDAVDAVIEAVKLKLVNDDDAPPEFQVFLNDLPSNDFNTLLRSPRLMEGCGYFAAAVPGSCHGRLFPKSSLHLVHSFYALQWLSHVPKEVENETSRAWNKGKILSTRAPREVVEAYSAQFAADMERFLQARVEELVSGGLMSLLLPFQGEDDRPEDSFISQLLLLLESTLMVMVAQGKLDEHLVDSFNLPLHLPTRNEFETLVERNGCFAIDEIRMFVSSSKPVMTFDAGMLSNQVRAIVEGMMRKHFGGDEMIDEIVERHRVEIEEAAQMLKLKLAAKRNLFVIIKRKPH